MTRKLTKFVQICNDWHFRYNQQHVDVVRTFGERLFHIYHPVFQNPEWYKVSEPVAEHRRITD